VLPSTLPDACREQCVAWLRERRNYWRDLDALWRAECYEVVLEEFEGR